MGEIEQQWRCVSSKCAGMHLDNTCITTQMHLDTSMSLIQMCLDATFKLNIF